MTWNSVSNVWVYSYIYYFILITLLLAVEFFRLWALENKFSFQRVYWIMCIQSRDTTNSFRVLSSQHPFLSPHFKFSLKTDLIPSSCKPAISTRWKQCSLARSTLQDFVVLFSAGIEPRSLCMLTLNLSSSAEPVPFRCLYVLSLSVCSSTKLFSHLVALNFQLEHQNKSSPKAKYKCSRVD